MRARRISSAQKRSTNSDDSSDQCRSSSTTSNGRCSENERKIATIALGAQFRSVGPVALGTTAGMMIANVPAVLLGNALIARVPLKTVRIVAALLFLAIGLWLLAGTAGSV